jgi:histone H3/H4
MQHIVERLAKAHDFESVGRDADVELDKLLHGVARMALDTVALVTPKHTVQPRDFATLSKLGKLLATPVGASEQHSQRSAPGRLKWRKNGPQTGGDPVWPQRFFDPNLSPSYGGYAPENGLNDGTAFPASGQYVRDGQCAAVFPSAVQGWGPPGLIDPQHCQAGGSSRTAAAMRGAAKRGWLPDETVARILHDYRERVNPELRVSDSAKNYLRELMERNVDGILALKGRSAATASATHRRLTGTTFRNAFKTWKLVVP